jgi:hypothetical protein
MTKPLASFRRDHNPVHLCECGCGEPTRNGWLFRKGHEMKASPERLAEVVRTLLLNKPPDRRREKKFQKAVIDGVNLLNRKMFEEAPVCPNGHHLKLSGPYCLMCGAKTVPPPRCKCRHILKFTQKFCDGCGRANPHRVSQA